MKNLRSLSTIVFVLLCLVWSSTWLAIKVGLRYLPPFTFAGVSFVTSTLWLLPIVKLLHKRLPCDWTSWKVMIFLGFIMMGIGFAFQYWGEQYVSSGLAGVLFATCPLFVVIFAHFLIEEEKITRWKGVGIMVSFVGLMVIFWQELTPVFRWNAEGSLLGAVAEVGSAVATALGIVVYRRFYGEIDRVVNLLVQTMIGAVFLLSLGSVWEGFSSFDLAPIAFVAVIYLGLATTVPFIGYYWLLENNSAINMSTITFITPMLAVALGWIFLGEQVTGSTILGGGLILAGVYFTFHRSEEEHTP